MILNIRGTGGAGKSFIARAVMSKYDVCEPYNTDPPTRKRPLGYICRTESHPDLFVLGHYETACGGGDTIKTPTLVYEMVDDWAARGYNVMFEGIISQDDVRRTVELHRKHPIKIIALRHPLAECLQAIADRRAVKGDARPVNPFRTTEREKSLKSVVTRLRDANVDCQWMTREEALTAALSTFGFSL